MANVTQLECLECGHITLWDFDSVEPVDDDAEPRCEECGSYDIDLAAISYGPPPKQ